MNIQVGDFVRGLPRSPYMVTNEKITRGLVTEISGNEIYIRIMEHEGGATGCYAVSPKYFEVVGHVKPFDRDEILGVLHSEDKRSILDYDLTNANLTDADLTHADLTGTNLTDADLTRADLTHANLTDADLTRADLTCADLTSASPTHADLTSADLTSADLTRANLTCANLTHANLTCANLTHANLTDADLTRANLTHADLTCTDLRGADLDYSSWPLWCGSLHAIVDVKLAAQLAYHLCAVTCDDPDFVKMRNSILWFANRFHRVRACGTLTEREVPAHV